MTSISVPSPRSATRQVRSSRPSRPSVSFSQAPNGVSAPSLSTQPIKGYPCVYTKEYQEYYVRGMERLEKGKGKEWSVKKREFQVMKEWEKEWEKRNGSEDGAEQASISQDGNLSENGAALAKSTVDEKSLNLPSQRNSIPSLLLNPPSSSDSSSSSSDLDFAPDTLGLHPNHLPASITHPIHSDVRKIYESPQKKATSFIVDPQQGFVEVEVEIEEGGQKHMHWLEQENEGEEEQVERQRNLEDEMDGEENDDYSSKEDRQEKMGSLLERIADKHEEEEGEGDGEMVGENEEVGDILKKSVTTIRGVVETEEDGEEEGDENRQELEDQLRRTLASSNLLDHIGANYRCDCYDDDDDQEMMKGVTEDDQYGMGIEGGLNSNLEDEEGNDDSDSLDRSNSLQQSQPPAPQPSVNERYKSAEEIESSKLKSLMKKKEQKKRKKEEKKRAKLAGELEKVKGEKRKAVDEVVSTVQGGSTEKKKTKGNRKGKD